MKPRTWLCATLLLTLSPSAAPTAKDREVVWPDHLRVVYLPADGREAVLRRFAPFNEYLGRMLGLEVEPISFDTYSEVIAFLSAGRFELAYLGPSTYSQAMNWLHLRALAMELDLEGRRGYYSLIICRPDRTEKSFADFSGRVFAFSSPESTSGFLVPLQHFLSQLKITPGMFAERVEFAGNHREVALGVLSGRYDSGVVASIDLERVFMERPEARKLRALWQSELLPGSLFCSHPDLPEGLAAAAEAVICNYGIDPARSRGLGVGGYVPATEADYLAMRVLESFRP